MELWPGSSNSNIVAGKTGKVLSNTNFNLIFLKRKLVFSVLAIYRQTYRKVEEYLQEK